MNFNTFRQAVAEQFAAMTLHQLFTTGTIVDPDATLNYPELAARFGDDLWTTYLGSFKEGENPIHRVRGVYDCSCCRNFIRKSNIVAIIDGKIQTIWDVKVPDFQHVADALAAAVRAQPINNVFLHDSSNLGTRQNVERDEAGNAITYDHFHVSVPAKYVKRRHDIPTLLNGPRTKQYTLSRAVREILPDAVSTVLELIASNSLARGDQFASLLREFKRVQNEILTKSTTQDFNTLTWEYSFKVGDALAAIRGSSIGTLLVELTADPGDLDGAVGRFERMVCGENYRRPTALVTPRMIEDAKAKVEELGLTSALSRRFATIDDISAKHVLFVDRESRARIKDNPFDDLTPTKKAPLAKLDQIAEVTIDQFLSDVLPTATSIEIGVERRHAAQKVALMTGVPGLFPWDNGFSWSYVGNFADAVKQRVKAAGGNVDGDVGIRLAWSNGDDLDLHVVENTSRSYHISYANRSSKSPSGGQLDVDANAGGNLDRGPHTPVENIVYADKTQMKPGNYRVFVHQYSRISPVDTGFTVDIDIQGSVHHFAMDNNPRNRGQTDIADIVVDKHGAITVVPLIKSSQSTTTPDFVKVNAIVASPNTWDCQHQVGQKHWFFLLDGWVMDEPTRGFYNEQLKPELNPHRKVFELLGAKMAVDPAGVTEQLVGLGFTPTGKDQPALVVRVKGNIDRTLKVLF
ncbi:hypothetical protein CPT_Seuss101 [Caulobacter phage Seuss]|uniref:Uncharacterized protein n=1 Tax=Caulobacter phage Seuss TaxID=1675601 RepID=A0A0K1LM80_9CAUD|nr:hypothetical protein HOR08_gp101 [Caulobacter phage Seuss]AKU43627.1 hypothetical protein CPT_Seuss101 [Caulobacter phage Seuss]